jgi:hypothetical protein
MLGAVRRTGIVASWRRRLPILLIAMTLPLVAMGTQLAAGALLPVALAGHRMPAGDKCRLLDPGTVGRVATVRPLPPRWLSLDQQLTAAGELVGRRLELTTAGGDADDIDLPAESSVAEPVGGVLVYTEAPANAPSEIHALDLTSGCDTRLAQSDQVVRGALIDPDGIALYVHSVSRDARDDLGITRIDLSSGVGQQVMPPLPQSDAFGPTFGTELHWSVGGDALAVQSCGFSSCRTRVLDIASGHVSTYDAMGQGEFIGLTSSRLLTYADCAGLPCDVLSTQLGTGEVSTLAAGAFGAALERDAADREVLSVETAAGYLEVEQ